MVDNGELNLAKKSSISGASEWQIIGVRQTMPTNKNVGDKLR